MAVVLVDTSIWIEAQAGLARHVDYGSVAICPPIAQELLQGAGDAYRFELAWHTILAARMLDDPMPLAAFEEAAHIYRLCLGGGYEIVSPYDCLIASCAIRNNVPLLQRDRDFEMIAKVTPLELLRNVSRSSGALASRRLARRRPAPAFAERRRDDAWPAAGTAAFRQLMSLSFRPKYMTRGVAGEKTMALMSR